MNFNLAETICRKHEDAIYRIAIDELRPNGSNTYTYGGLDYLSDKFATVLQSCGVRIGDVVAVILPLSAAYLVAHLGALKVGAVVAPLSSERDTGLLANLLQTSRATAIVIEERLLNDSNELFENGADATLLIASDYVSKNDFPFHGKGFWREINFADDDFNIATTDESTPAYIFLDDDDQKQSISTILNHGVILTSLSAEYQSVSGSIEGENPEIMLNQEPTSEPFMKELWQVLWNGQQIRTGNSSDFE